MSLITRLISRKAPLNFTQGFRLLQSREVPARLKLVALTFGIAVTLLIEILELPVDAVVAVLLPFAGELLDLAFDGVEFLILPVLLASLVIRRLVARNAQMLVPAPTPYRKPHVRELRPR